MKYKEAYEKYNDKEFLSFGKVVNKLSNRMDLHAFILLDKLVPEHRDMIVSAEHDQIWIDVELEKLDAVATEEQMLELIRCGVMYDEKTDSLSMFV